MGLRIVPKRKQWVQTQVRCYSGYKGEEYPTSFWEGEAWREVASIIDRWYDPNANYFKVVTKENRFFLLKWDLLEDQWVMKPLQ